MTGPDEDDVVTWLADDFALDVVALVPVVGGADPAARVWQATTGRGGLLAVKWTRRQTRTGLRLASSLQAAGLGGTAHPLTAADGRPWSRRADGRLSVARWVDGLDAATVGLDLDQWCDYGALLAAVHEHRFPAPERRTGARRGIRRRRRRYRHHLAELDALTAAPDTASAMPGRDDVDARGARDAWRDAAPRIARLVEGSRIPIAADPPLVPCHGDPHLGNVVVDASGRLSLIDWDEAVAAPRELDLHLVEFSVLFAPTTADQLVAFRRGYGPVELDEARLVRFACVRALEDLVATARAAILGPASARTDELRVFHGILSPVGSASLVEPRLDALLGR